jgi:hypothetical protein
MSTHETFHRMTSAASPQPRRTEYPKENASPARHINGLDLNWGLIAACFIALAFWLAVFAEFMS